MYRIHRLNSDGWSKPKCEKINGKYIDKNGNEISKTEIYNVEEIDD